MKTVLKQQIITESASARQGRASDPLRSAWVGASAGTGKTKVLIDRVLRLMLPRPGMGPESATPPEKILCLTFTKTAAAEMSNRIYQRLSEWAVMDDAKLAEKLAELIGATPSKEAEAEARRLFARTLDAPGGLKIMTIHSFCQSILKRFPVEAGLAPHFQLMDEDTAVEHLTQCLHDIIAETRRVPDGLLASSFNALALLLTPEEMSDLMSKIMAKRSLLSAILRRQGDEEGKAVKTVAAIYKRLGVDVQAREEDIYGEIANIHPEDEKNLRRALEGLLQGSDKDRERAKCMQPFLEQKARRSTLFAVYRHAFFTKDGSILKKMGTKAAITACLDLEAVMLREAERLHVLQEKLRALRLAEVNKSLMTVAAEMVGRYETFKRDRACLDFDDLIIRACELLSGEGTVEWVLFKLDQGIDHILVDEAQDTSPQQWRVVKALADEFFSGSGAKDGVLRTLFVVGDEKQSIYSFQGADPNEFARMQAHFAGRVIEKDWKIRLDHSFRSTSAVLEVVDTVFADTGAKSGVVFDVAEEILHLPFREGHAGTVELWPLVTAENAEDPPPWKLPTEIEPGESAAAKLAKQTAAAIRGWIDAGDILPSKGRPVRAGDVLILVQSRGAFVEMLMRSLKEAGVDVAGIDRMTLTEEIAIMDMVAAANFALLPQDDLTLATLLKSPFVGLSEEELFSLCHNRRGALWYALKDKRPDIASWLQGLPRKAGHATPYEFFAHLLVTPCFADAVSGKRALLSRLGHDIEDAVGEFLNACLHYEQSHTPSLQSFVDWFMKGDTEIKREQETARADQIRIMTVHASKGLQAPIVILPDTVKILHDHNKGRVRLLWPEDENGVPLWSPRTEFDAAEYETLREAAARKQEEEYRRLLYVALTRAEDRLYIAGYHGKKEPRETCWYKTVERCFPASAQELEANGMTVRRLHHPQVKPVKPVEIVTTVEEGREALPTWAFSPPPDEPTPSVPLAPSRPGEDEPAAKGPLDTDEGWKFRRGVIAHRILESLPQLPIARREKALAAYLARKQLGLSAQEQSSFAREIMAVLNHPDFAPIFGEGSAAEVPVVGLAEKHVLSGQMDRVLVRGDDVLIVDYKTNRPPPREESGVAAVYLRQMAAYVSVMKKIYPNKNIRCALLWTDGPHLMPLSDKLLDPYLL